MKVIAIAPADMARWEDYVQSSPRTVAWQSYHWNQAVTRNYDAEFHPLAVEEEGTIRGILPLYRLRGPKASSRLISVPFAVAGGIAANDTAAAQALLDAGIELSQRLGMNGITFKQYRYPAPGSLKLDANYFNRELALQMGVSPIWDQLEERNRRAIEAADKRALTLEYPLHQIDEFYDLLLGFLTRSGMPCPSRRWIQTLLDLKMYAIALLRYNGRPVAGTMVKTFKTTVSFPYTCNRTASEDSLQATYALYWRLIQGFIAEGYEIFHSGRMPESEDVDPYRLGWGGEKHTYYYQYYPETEGQTEYRNKRGWKRTLFITCWKRMPKSLASVIGPKIVAKFP